MRSRPFRALLVACLVTLAAVPVAGQSASVPPILAGVFVHPDVGGARGTVLAALEPHIAMLPYFAQPLIRSRIEERLALPHTVRVALEGADVAVTYETDRVVTVRSPLGSATTITSRDGAEIPVTQDLHLGWLRQVFTGENGTLTVLLSTEPDGATLHLDATAHGERLPADVPVRLDYVRAP